MFSPLTVNGRLALAASEYWTVTPFRLSTDVNRPVGAVDPDPAATPRPPDMVVLTPPATPPVSAVGVPGCVTTRGAAAIKV
jgi:hypothetical protein